MKKKVWETLLSVASYMYSNTHRLAYLYIIIIM